MPESARRHNRSLNLTDEIWTRLHQAYLAVGQASPEPLRKSDFVDRVLQAGISAVLAQARVTLPSRQVQARELAPPRRVVRPDTPPPAAAPPSPPPRTPARPPAASRPRQTAAERRRETAARLTAIAAPPLRPPAIQSAALAEPPASGGGEGS